MPKIQKLSVYSFLAIVVFVVSSYEDWFVSAQDQAGTDYWTPIIAAAPGAVMGLVNLALVSRLASPSNRGGLIDGITRFFPGLNQDQKKMMLFMGKHNIQVSNHKNSDGVEDSGDCGDDCEDDNDDDDDEDEDDDNNDEDKGEDKDKYKDKAKYKSKNKKEKNGKYKDSGDDSDDEEEEGSDDKYQKKYKKQKSSGYGMNGYQQFGVKPYQNSGFDEMDLKSMMIKNAMALQYPNIDQSQVYWPQTDESKTTGFRSEPDPTTNPGLLLGIPKKMQSKGKTLLPVFTPTPSLSPMSPINTMRSGFHPISDSRMSDTPLKDTKNNYNVNRFEDSIEDFRPNIESNSDENFSNFNNFNDDFINSDTNFNDEEFRRNYRKKRSTDNGKGSSNRAGNVPPLRHNKNSTKSSNGLDISPETVKFLLSTINKKGQNDKKFNEKNIKKASKKSNKKSPKSESSEGEVLTKSSSNRVLSSTKVSMKESAQPVKYLPLDQYRHILDFTADRKQDNGVRGRGRGRRRNRNRNRGKDIDEDDEDEDDDQDGDDEKDDENLFDDEELPEEGHTTIQIIEKPDEKFNVGIGSWMKRMFSFRSGGRRRGVFGQTNNFR